MRGTAPADIELAVSELERAPAGSKRHADLLQFLALTSRDVAESMSHIEGEVATIARQTQIVQDVLAEQRNFRQLGPLMDTVPLAQILLDSVNIVPDDSKARLLVDIDPSVEAVGQVRVARTTLQQIFQNLIVNAAEAIREAGRERGRLRISAEVVRGPNGGRIRMRFEDDGIGIAADQLERIFERGFSTKSPGRNAGIGLHWSANAINALGGALRATSNGLHEGACFHIDVPFDDPHDSAVHEAA